MILMYHNLGPKASFNTVAEADFQHQMEWLISQGYAIVPMDRYVEALQQGGVSDNEVVLSFDDGYESFEAIALPHLSRLSLPAVVYVPTDFVGKANVWDDGQIPIMGWDALREVSGNSLVSIGSHGMGHRRMRSLGSEEIRQKTLGSKALLEQQLGKAVHHFSYPYGQLKDFDGRCRQLVQAAGYQSACSTLWGLRNGRKDLYALHRLEIEPEDGLQRFQDKVRGRLQEKIWRQRAKNLLFRLHLRR